MVGARDDRKANMTEKGLPSKVNVRARSRVTADVRELGRLAKRKH